MANILDKLKDMAGRTEVIVLSIAIILSLLNTWRLSCNVAKLEDEMMDTRNTLAETDHLREVYADSTFRLSERFSKVSRDLSASLDREKRLKNYVKSKDGTVLSLVESSNELRIENERLRGIAIQDSIGQHGGEFDVKTPQYELRAQAFLSPMPVLNIVRLVVPDSTYVGIIRSGDGHIRGFISHSNPLVKDKGASFEIALEAVREAPVFSLEWWHGVGLLVIGVVIGIFL